MKKILGLDLGTNSIGWAYVNEADKQDETSSIIKLGVRVNPLTVDESTKFEKGKSITTNADRTNKRSARRNLQRYKLRREHLIDAMKRSNIISDDSILTENGNATTFETYRLRAKAVEEEVSLAQFARILLQINKKRGYKSSRKVKGTEDGQLIDGMKIAIEMCDRNLTPGQFVYNRLLQGKFAIPDFYRSDLQKEFDKIWQVQKCFYPAQMTDEVKEKTVGKNKSQTWGILKDPFRIVGVKRTTKGLDQKIETYKWRCNALTEQIGLEELAVVLQEINGQISGSSGYLGGISDRSKVLYFNNQTVGQYQMSELEKNPHFSLKNQVFYRQDYMDEFERIWETQAKFHKELTDELKHEVRDYIIFHQRRLKSQKGLISICELEGKEVEIECDGKIKKKLIGPHVCPKSSPLFQEFKTWQVLNNITVKFSDNKRKIKRTDKFVDFESGRYLFPEEKELLIKELRVKEKLSASEVLNLLFGDDKSLELNFKQIEGNRTQAELFKAYAAIVETSGHNNVDFSKGNAEENLSIVKQIFETEGFKTDFIAFDYDSKLSVSEFEQQPMFRLWHLLYSYEGDNSATGDQSLVSKVSEITNMPEEYARIIANVVFQEDYGNLSTKAIRKILPYLQEGNEYSVACEYAGYRHSKQSLTKEEIDNKVLKDRLDVLPKNSLRNPVVEKIINQMIHVVNGVVETYGRPDEIRIELARELKKSAKERSEMTANVEATTRLHGKLKEEITRKFGIENVSRNDIIRYKLYLELASNGFKTLYSNTYIPEEKIFSKEFDIEHIIPQAKLFDDSFSNKTLEVRSVNLKKSNATALDFVQAEYGESGVEEYKNRIEKLFKDGQISKAKRNKLLMTESEIPNDFINRDLRDSQYISKKAQEILGTLVRSVVATTGSVTDRLREDWQLVDVMKELNWEKYEALGMVEYFKDKDGRTISRIKDWTKRNDHRHHAMDALTIAFTKRSYIQYLNNLNARVGKGIDDYVDLSEYDFSKLSKSERTSAVYGIERKELYRNEKGRLLFIPPMPLDQFRKEAKKHLENILVSIKAKNKVTTKNVNKARNKKVTEVVTASGEKRLVRGQVTQTPRGQLHNETVYGRLNFFETKEEKVGGSFDAEHISMVSKKIYREALAKRLAEFNGDAKKAFTGKNALDKNPIWLDGDIHANCVPAKVTVLYPAVQYTIREKITPDLKVDKIIDPKVREVLVARLKEYGNDAKKAFADIENNPIYLNKEKGIAIKRVTIKGKSNVVSLREKRDKFGNIIIDENGQRIPSDYVSTNNNHHVAIYRDKEGNIQDCPVSFFEATTRKCMGLPIIDKEYRQDDGWHFLFTMKQNEYFVFPNEKTGFNPKEVDLMDPSIYNQISQNIYRVQTMSKVVYGNSAVRDYVFRHHLETSVTHDIKDITYKQFKNINFVNCIVKVRVNHIGQIVGVGEY